MKVNETSGGLAYVADSGLRESDQVFDEGRGEKRTMQHEFIVALYRPTDDLPGTAELNLPFSWSDYDDAQEKLRASDGITPIVFELIYAKQEVLVPHTLKNNNGTLADIQDLLELNLLAQRLDSMSATMHDCFEAQVTLEERVQGSGEAIPVARLINLSYQTANCIPGDRSQTYAELGAFLFENDMVSDDIYDKTIVLVGSMDTEMPKEWLTFVGRQHFEANGGVFTDKGYFECPTEIPEDYRRGEQTYLHRDNAPVVLEIINPYGIVPEDGELSITLGLPTTDAELAVALGKINADSIEQCAWRCTECLVPAAKEWLAWADGFYEIAAFAACLETLENEGRRVKYKALLQAAECSNLSTALCLSADVDAYEFTPNQWEPAEYGRAALYSMCGKESAASICAHMDCHGYGLMIMQHENAVLTDYGIIRRKDGELIQAQRTVEAAEEMATERGDIGEFYVSPDFQCEQTKGHPAMLVWNKESGKVILQLSPAFDDGSEQSKQCIRDCADWGVHPCESTADYNALLENLGSDAVNNAYLPEEDETEEFGGMKLS